MSADSESGSNLKRAGLEVGSGGDGPSSKRRRIDEGNEVLPSALYDPAAWDILIRFLTSSMSMSEMDDALAFTYLIHRKILPHAPLHLGPRDACQALPFASHTNDPKNSFILDMAEVGDDEDDEDEEEGYGDDEEGYGGGTTVCDTEVSCNLR
ncbi:hypothetical protein P692DRAFT_20817882 [Suillus brevipes Sb2]|nr:hypothetical protein P692DRAFT_20817882 [Suillus brevipes Sb2]